MDIELTPQQKADWTSFRTFARSEVAPTADHCDQEEYTPPELIKKVARQGYLGAVIPQAYGGIGMDMLTFGLLNEEIG